MQRFLQTVPRSEARYGLRPAASAKTRIRRCGLTAGPATLDDGSDDQAPHHPCSCDDRRRALPSPWQAETDGGWLLLSGPGNIELAVSLHTLLGQREQFPSRIPGGAIASPALHCAIDKHGTMFGTPAGGKVEASPLSRRISAYARKLGDADRLFAVVSVCHHSLATCYCHGRFSICAASQSPDQVASGINTGEGRLVGSQLYG